MRHYILLFLWIILLCACENKGQHDRGNTVVLKRYTTLDSIQNELKKAREDTNKVYLLNDLSIYYSLSSFEQAIQYGKEALWLSEKLKWKPGMAESNQNIGLGYLAKSDYPNAKKHFLEALKRYQDLGNSLKIAESLGNLGELHYSLADYSKALEYYFKALRIFEELSDKNGEATIIGKIGTVYFFLKEPCTLQYLNNALEMNQALGNKRGIAENLRFIGNVNNHWVQNHQKALDCYLKALKIEEELGNKPLIARNKVNIGIAYGFLNKHVKELEYKFDGLRLYKELGDKGGVASAYGNLGWSFYFLGTDTHQTLDPVFREFHIKNKRNALNLSRTYMDSSGKLFFEIGEADNETYAVMSKIDSILGNYKDAYLNFKKSATVKEQLYGEEKTKSIAQMRMQYEYDKKEIEEKAELERKHIIQRNIRNSILGGLIAVLIILFGVLRQRKMTLIEKKRSDDLLLNILPSEVAEELKAKGATTAKEYSQVTVLFTDFKNFTLISETLSAQELVNEINYCYSAFDNIITRFGLEKIKTIGDAYMCAGGLPVVNTTHAEDTVRAALAIRDFMEEEKQKRIAAGKPYFEIRIGCHTGSVVAGIVGIKKFAYDIWGDTVNIASRIESSGEPGKVNISGSTYTLIQDKFNCEYRGKIQAKNKGEIDMYFVHDYFN